MTPLLQMKTKVGLESMIPPLRKSTSFLCSDINGQIVTATGLVMSQTLLFPMVALTHGAILQRTVLDVETLMVMDGRCYTRLASHPTGDADAFPDDPTQWRDSDGDGFGDNTSETILTNALVNMEPLPSTG